MLLKAWLKNYYELARFSLRGQLRQLEDTNRNVLDFTNFRNQVHQREF